MAFFCPTRQRHHPKKARENGDGVEVSSGSGFGGGRGALTRSWTKRKMTGSTSIETLVLVGLESATAGDGGGGGMIPGGAYADAMRTVTRAHAGEMGDEVTVSVGQTVVIIFRDDDWLFVVTDKGTEGFIPRENCVRSKKMRTSAGAAAAAASSAGMNAAGQQRRSDDNGNDNGDRGVISPPGDQNGNKNNKRLNPTAQPKDNDVEQRLKSIHDDLKQHSKNENSTSSSSSKTTPSAPGKTCSTQLTHGRPPSFGDQPNAERRPESILAQDSSNTKDHPSGNKSCPTTSPSCDNCQLQQQQQQQQQQHHPRSHPSSDPLRQRSSSVQRDVHKADSRSRESLSSHHDDAAEVRLPPPPHRPPPNADPNNSHVFQTSSGKIELSETLAKHIGSTPRKSPKPQQQQQQKQRTPETAKLKSRKPSGTRSPSFVSPLQQCIKEGRLKGQDSQRLTTSMTLNRGATGSGAGNAIDSSAKSRQHNHHGSHQVLFDRETELRGKTSTSTLFHTPQHRPTSTSGKADGARAVGVVPPHVASSFQKSHLHFGSNNSGVRPPLASTDSSSGCQVETSSSSMPSPPQMSSTTPDMWTSGPAGVDSGTGADSPRWGDKSPDSEAASTSSSSTKEIRQTWRQRKIEIQGKDRRDASSLEDRTDAETPNVVEPGCMTLPASFRGKNGAVGSNHSSAFSKPQVGSDQLTRRQITGENRQQPHSLFGTPSRSQMPNSGSRQVVDDIQRATRELKEKLVLSETSGDKRKTKVIQENIPLRNSGGVGKSSGGVIGLGGKKTVAMTRKYWLIPENLNISEIKIFSRVQHGDADALWDFFAVEENDVSLVAGECVTVLNDEDPDWTWVLKRDGDEGFVPANHLGTRQRTPQDDEDDDYLSPSKRTAPAGKVSVIVHSHENDVPALDFVKEDPTSPSGVLTRLDDTFLHDHFGVVRLIAEFDFQDPRVLDFVVKKDEFLLADMVGQSDEEWLWVTACSSGQQGWIPKNFVKQISYVD